MTWHYACPGCGQDLGVDWDWHRDEVTCPNCHNTHYPPTPSEDHYAHFAGEHWPQELTDAVLRLRGTTCGVPGCFLPFSVLVHRRPPALGGLTSVDNLRPLCAEHAQAKGNQDYDEWLAGLKAAAPAQPTMEITITAKTPPSAEPPPLARAAGLAISLGGKAGPVALPASLRLVAAVPFLPGAVNRLVLSYDWRLGSAGTARLALLAWPRDLPPSFSPDGTADCPQADAAHSGKAGDSGSARLELVVSDRLERRWVAVVAADDAGARLEIGEYVLAGTV